MSTKFLNFFFHLTFFSYLPPLTHFFFFFFSRKMHAFFLEPIHSSALLIPFTPTFSGNLDYQSFPSFCRLISFSSFVIFPSLPLHSLLSFYKWISLCLHNFPYKFFFFKLLPITAKMLKRRIHTYCFLFFTIPFLVL